MIGWGWGLEDYEALEQKNEVWGKDWIHQEKLRSHHNKLLYPRIDLGEWDKDFKEWSYKCGTFSYGVGFSIN